MWVVDMGIDPGDVLARPTIARTAGRSSFRGSAPPRRCDPEGEAAVEALIVFLIIGGLLSFSLAVGSLM